MRIAQIAPLFEPVPPKLYGGTERVVGGLTEELIRRGHEVVLFASGDSHTSAHLVPCSRRALRLDPAAGDPAAYVSAQVGRVARLARSFDLIHNHVGHLAFALARLVPVPTISTMHGRLDLPEIADLFEEFDDVALVSISDAQRAPLPDARWAGTVYNGIDVGRFTVRERSGQYLAFLGRVSPEKGPARAIEIARAAGMPLRMAAKVDPADRDYFEMVVRPMLNRPDVEFIGEIDEAAKSEFLGNAYAYLFPIDWPEPFGITMVEAMACGTPVIATAAGSVPEIVDHGRTGFICRTIEEMIDAVAAVPRIDRRRCRAHVEARFTVARMTDGYEAVYRRVTALGQAPRRGEPSAQQRPA
jgi:glycosyltransferase involved in cell wall biosynthesis